MKKILVVDNHPVMLKFMKDLLVKKGHQVVTAENGLSALTCLETFSPDVVFSDLVMPNINGEKLCRVIRSMPEYKDVFLVILSGIAIEENLDFKKFGADACIAKGPLNKMADLILHILDQSERTEGRKLPEAVVGIENLYHRDVTEELLSSKKHSEVILNNMAEGILELTPEEKIIFTNPASISLIGIPEEKLLGSTFTSLFPINHRGIIKNILKELGDTPRIISEDEPVVLNDKQVSLTFLPVKDQKNSSVIVILNDIDERKRLEAQLNQARRMEAIATLAGGIAHEFNNALVGVSGNIELLKMDLPQDASFDTYTDAMIASVHRMSKLTKRLLAYARGGKYRTEIMTLSIFAEEALPLLVHKIDPSIRIETDLPPDTSPVEIDQTQMHMVLSALMDNAAEAIADKGRIRVVSRNSIVDDAFAKGHPGLKPGKYACLMVEDDGSGMDESIRRKAFDPFLTTKFQGRGLGLSAAYGIVKNHNGWISIESELGKGTVVSIYLPVEERTKEK